MTTLHEFLSQAAGGVPESELRRIFGIDFDLRKTDDYLQSGDFFTTTYGKKVWDTLNSEIKFWSLLRKVPYGPTVGWRNRTARGGSSAPIAEMGALPDVTHSTISDIYSNPRSVVTALGVTELAQFLGGREGGIGDALATEQNFASIDHIKELQQELLLPAVGVVTTAGASATGAIKPVAGFRVGDYIFCDGMTGDYGQIDVLGSDGVIEWGEGGSLVDGDVVTIGARRGITSLDDIVEQDSRTHPGANLVGGPDCYNLTTRTAGTYAASIVLDNDGTARDITTALVDEAIRLVREAGGEPDLILTGHDQEDNLAALLQAQHRYMGTGTFQVKRGGVATLLGFQGGFQMATYRGIPIFGDSDCTKSYAAAAGAAQGSNVYVLDTRFLEIAMAVMTKYVESRDYIANDVLGIKAIFWTMAELRCVDLTKQAKITDLNASL